MDQRSTFPADKRIAFTGRFASLSRARAVEILTDRGGLFRSRVTHRTDLLVIGADGWPIRPTGTLTRNLSLANRLVDSGHKIEIIGEAAFIRRVDGLVSGSSIRATHTIEQLSRLLGVSGLRVRHWIELGLLQASSENGCSPTFDFQAVTSARLISRLITSGVSASKLADSLRTLQRWLPEDQSLRSSIVALENRLLVRTRIGQLIDVNGQTHFAFDENADVKLTIPPENDLNADGLFELAFAAEQSGNFDVAVRHYESWIDQFGCDEDVLFNLANTLSQTGHDDAAIKMYRQLIDLSPDRVSAWNNLGLCEYRCGETMSAIHSLQRAAALDPRNLDTLYNLADALDESGNESAARVLWVRIARSRTQDDIVEYARARIQLLNCVV